MESQDEPTREFDGEILIDSDFKDPKNANEESGSEKDQRIDGQEKPDQEKMILPPPVDVPRRHLMFDRPITEKEKITDTQKVGQTTLQREMVICLRRIVKNLDIMCLLILIFFIVWTTKNISNDEMITGVLTGIASFLLGFAQILLPKGRWAEQILFKLLKKNIDSNYRTFEGD